MVPLPPGGTNDIMARAIADKMSAALGQQVVVENRASGGSGTVASRAVARGPADGYTLLLAYTTTLATAPYILPDVGYDVRKDFAPIGLIGYAPALLLVHPGVSLSQRRRSDRGHQGVEGAVPGRRPSVGSVNHLAAVLFADQAGVKLQYIPYKGSGPLNTDLVGGHRQGRLQPDPAVARRDRRQAHSRARRHLAEALGDISGPAHRRGIGPAGIRRRVELRHRRGGRHAAADRRQAQQGAARRRSPPTR